MIKIVLSSCRKLKLQLWCRVDLRLGSLGVPGLIAFPVSLGRFRVGGDVDCSVVTTLW